jgi:D-amino-acid dehydrogenase
MNPNEFILAIKQALEGLGVTILYEQEVVGFDKSVDKINSVRTVSAEYFADEIVLATGAFTPPMAKLLGNRLLIEAGKGYSVDYYEESLIPELSYILVEARVAITPLEKFVRVAGTMEIAGLDQTVNKRRVAGYLKAVKDYLPEFKFEAMKDLPAWAGLRPCSPDGLPYVGRDPKYDNLIVAAGHAMLGFTLGPATGKLVSELVMGQTLSLNIDKLAVNRF